MDSDGISRYGIDPETGMGRPRNVDIVDDNIPPPLSPSEASDEVAGEEVEEAAPTPSPPRAKKYTCKYCGMEFDNPLDLGRHVRKEHRDEVRAEREAKMAPPASEVVAGGQERPQRNVRMMTDDEIFADITMRGQAALEELLRARLEELLDMPSIPKESKEYALREWDSDPTIHLDFHALSEALYDAGIKPDKVQRVVSRLVALYNKFAPALQYPQQSLNYPNTGPQTQQPYYGGAAPTYPYQGPPSVPPHQGYPNPAYPPPGPYYQYPYPPQYPGQYPPPYYPQPPVRQVTEDQVRDMVSHAVRDAIKEMMQSQQSSQNAGGQLVEAEIPIAYSSDGTPIMGKVRGDSSAVMGLLVASRGSAPAGKQELPPLDQLLSPFRDQIEELSKKVEEAEKRADEAEKRHLESQIASIKEEMDKMRQTYEQQLAVRDKLLENMPRGEYRSDTMRMVDSVISRVDDMVKDRRPLDKLVDLLTKTPPPAQMTSDVAALNELKKAGLVANE
jgi:hypothetical protein